MSGGCTPKEYQRSLLHDGTILCLTKGSTIGLVVSHILSTTVSAFKRLTLYQVIVEAAFVSLVAISWLFAIIIVCWPFLTVVKITGVITVFNVGENDDVRALNFTSGKVTKNQ